MRRTQLDSLSINGEAAMLGGSCLKDGAPCTFTVSATDSLCVDTFVIVVEGSPPEGGPLRKGDIRIHSPPPFRETEGRRRLQTLEP